MGKSREFKRASNRLKPLHSEALKAANVDRVFDIYCSEFGGSGPNHLTKKEFCTMMQSAGLTDLATNHHQLEILYNAHSDHHRQRMDRGGFHEALGDLARHKEWTLEEVEAEIAANARRPVREVEPAFYKPYVHKTSTRGPRKK